MVGSGPLKVGLLQIICTLDRQQRREKDDKVSMSDFCELASYDWLDSVEHTIAVPGRKPLQTW